MDTEEMIRAQPMDAVVLLAGCDKTTPAALMGAASADVPAIMISGGPMLNGRHDGKELGACTDCGKYTAELRAGTIDADEYTAIEDAICRSAGSCMVMGTASTMASMAEALGMAHRPTRLASTGSSWPRPGRFCGVGWVTVTSMAAVSGPVTAWGGFGNVEA
jgi:dihydroxy-acid dehydratase